MVNGNVHKGVPKAGWGLAMVQEKARTVCALSREVQRCAFIWGTPDPLSQQIQGMNLSPRGR